MHYKMYSYANSPQPLNRNIPLSILVFPYQIMNLINRSREWAVWGVLVSEKYPVDMERLISFQFKYRDHDTQVSTHMNVGVGAPNNSKNIDFHWWLVSCGGSNRWNVEMSSSCWLSPFIGVPGHIIPMSLPLPTQLSTFYSTQGRFKKN